MTVQPYHRGLHYWFVGLLIIAHCTSLVLSEPVAGAEPDWVRRAVAKSLDYEVSPGASALILHKSATVEVKSEGWSTMMVRVALKVLTQQGVTDTYLAEPVGEHRSIRNLRGWLIDRNGRCRDLKKENIAEIDVTGAAGYYSDFRQLTAAFPDVSTGDVVAYEYTAEEKGGWESCYQAFTFQIDLPVLFASFDMTIPSGWDYKVTGRNIEGMTHWAEKSNLNWSVENLDYRPEEPLMPPWNYVARRIQINCYQPLSEAEGHFSDWGSTSRWAAALHDQSLVLEPPVILEAERLTANINSPWDCFRAIAEYVRDRIRYVAVEIGEGRFRPRPCSITWYNKYGDCKDKVTLMRGMLQAVNISSRPILVSLGRPVEPDLPTPLQFDHVILGVPREALGDIDTSMPALHDGWVFFDPTQEAIPPGWLPKWLYGSRGLRLSDYDSTLIQFPALDLFANRRLHRANVVLKPDHSISGSVCMLDYGAAAFTAHRERAKKNPADNISVWRGLLAKTMRGLEISGFDTNIDGDSAWVQFDFTATNYLKSTGRFGLLDVDFFHPDEHFELKSKERVHPVWFGMAGQFETDITWTWPDFWKAVELPSEVVDSCATATVRCSSATDRNSIRTVTLYRRTGRVENIDDYPQARSFYRNLRSAYESKVLFDND